MKNRSTLLIIATLLSLQAYAGADKGGNGGSGVVCRSANGQIKSATVLDLFEGNMLHGISQEMGDSSIGYQDKIKLVIDRVDQRDPELANLLRQDWSGFLNNIQFLSGINLVLIPDAYPVAVTQGCAIEQIAIHQKDILPGEKRFLINKDLWDAMDNNNKAALVLHEIIYARASAKGATDSRTSRYLVAVITSNSISEMSYVDYINLIKTIGISEIETLNVFGYLLKNFFVDEKSVISGDYVGGKDSITIEGHLIPLMKGQVGLGFYPDGTLYSISGSPQPYVLTRAAGGQSLRFQLDKNHGLTFYSDGRLMSGHSLDSYTFVNDGHIYKTPVKSDSEIMLNQDGNGLSFYPASEEMMKARGLKTNGKPEYIIPNYPYTCEIGKDVDADGNKRTIYRLVTLKYIPLTPDGLVDMSVFHDVPNELQEGRCR